MATTAKLAFQAGFEWNQVVAGQVTAGLSLFFVAFIIRWLRGKKPEKLTLQQFVKLIGMGLVACTTTVVYNFALTMLPVSVAITLLFQFTWIGIVIQIVATKRFPTKAEVIAALVIFCGTLLSSGFFEANLEGLNPLGIVCGLLSAVSCAFFVHLSGRVEVRMQSIQRGFIISLGTVLLGMTVCPDFLVSTAFVELDIWKYAYVLGFFGFFGPVILLGIGTPHLPTGLSTIMASAELPVAVMISIFILHEAVTMMQLIGVVVILSGVIISQLPQLLSLYRKK